MSFSLRVIRTFPAGKQSQLAARENPPSFSQHSAAWVNSLPYKEPTESREVSNRNGETEKQRKRKRKEEAGERENPWGRWPKTIFASRFYSDSFSVFHGLSSLWRVQDEKKVRGFVLHARYIDSFQERRRFPAKRAQGILIKLLAHDSCHCFRETFSSLLFFRCVLRRKKRGKGKSLVDVEYFEESKRRMKIFNV